MAEHSKEYTPDREGYEQSLKDLDEIEPAPKPAYSKVIVALCLVIIIAFTVTSFVYLWNGKPLNDTLTVLFFGCFGLEFASLAFIKGREVRYVEGNAANRQPPHVEAKEEDQDGEVSE
ncbi:MAG: hypothetical protein IJ111_05710 [Eggerthellaceae bacterium]|nr:hypothetical protein [Eggerthellaceae bacterium]